jgi:RND family efflux transporter MFP subunit
MSAAGARSATKKTSKIVLSAAALTAAVGLGTAAVIFGPAAATSREPDRAVQLDPRQGPQLVQIAVAKPAVASERAFTGVVAARVQSNLGFRVPGKVVERLVDIGQEVHAGQPLMRLDPKDLDLALTAKKNAVAAARAAAVQARDDEVRYRDLAAAGWASRQRYEQAKAAFDTAAAQLAAAEAEARVAENEATYSVLVADADGTVIETLGEPGQVVAAGQVAVRLAHAGPREASIDLPETVRPAIGSAAQASLYGDDAKFPARLRQLSGAADPLTRTYEARYILGGAGAQAPLGATVTVYLPTGAPATATSLPLSALDDEGKGPGVWILDVKKSRVSFHPVQVIQIGGETAMISGGLTVGQQIVALGGHFLHQGEHVRVAHSTAAVQ